MVICAVGKQQAQNPQLAKLFASNYLLQLCIGHRRIETGICLQSLLHFTQNSVLEGGVGVTAPIKKRSIRQCENARRTGFRTVTNNFVLGAISNMRRGT